MSTFIYFFVNVYLEREIMEANADFFSGKTILFVNSGWKLKEFTLRTAKELGLRIVLLNSSMSWQKKYVDEFIQADTYNHEDCLSKLRGFLCNKKIDGAITFWEDDVPLLAKICKEFGFRGLSIEAAENARNKFSMRKAFGEKQMPQPKYALVKSKEDLQKAIDGVGFPAVIKPCWGADGEFVIKIDDTDSAEKAYDYVLKTAKPKFNPIYKYNNSEFIYEEYLVGKEVSVEAITQNKTTAVVAISDKFFMKEPYLMERGDLIPTTFETENRRKIKDAVTAAIDALGIDNCVTHTDVKMTPNGARIIEVNARLGGDYLPHWVKDVWDIDLVKEALLIALDGATVEKPHIHPKKYLCGKYFVPEQSGIVSRIQGIDSVAGNDNIHELYVGKKIGEPVLIPPEGYENLGWLVAKGNNAAEAEQNLDNAFSAIQFTVSRFKHASSIGQSMRKTPDSAALIARNRILRSARIEKIRLIDEEKLPKLHVGVLCNLYPTNGKDKPGAVEQDLMSVGKNIEAALNSRGHKVSFFDMNETPLPFLKIMKSKVDMVFNVCERINDSSLLEPHAAAFLDMLEIPYTGSNSQTLGLCIDKIRVKKLLEYHGIPTPKWDYIYDLDDEFDEELNFPIIIKPANADNSIGISNESVVTNEAQLEKQLKYIVEEIGSPALLEEYIEGDEYDLSIIGNEDNLRVLPITRSMFSKMPKDYWHIYAFDSKWEEDVENPYDGIETQSPAKVPKRLTSLLTELAIDTYNILDCHDYGRVELRVDKNNNPYVLELNPNPSINKGDEVPGTAELIGMSYEDFIEEILKSAIRRYRDRPPHYHLRTSTTPL